MAKPPKPPAVKRPKSRVAVRERVSPQRAKVPTIPKPQAAPVPAGTIVEPRQPPPTTVKRPRPSGRDYNTSTQKESKVDRAVPSYVRPSKGSPGGSRPPTGPTRYQPNMPSGSSGGKKKKR